MVVCGVGGGSQRLVSPNPTIMLVVLFLELWLLLGCDNLYHPGSNLFRWGTHLNKQCFPSVIFFVCPLTKFDKELGPLTIYQPMETLV